MPSVKYIVFFTNNGNHSSQKIGNATLICSGKINFLKHGTFSTFPLLTYRYKLIKIWADEEKAKSKTVYRNRLVGTVICSDHVLETKRQWVCEKKFWYGVISAILQEIINFLKPVIRQLAKTKPSQLWPLWKPHKRACIRVTKLFIFLKI